MQNATDVMIENQMGYGIIGIDSYLAYFCDGKAHKMRFYPVLESGNEGIRVSV